MVIIGLEPPDNVGHWIQSAHALYSSIPAKSTRAQKNLIRQKFSGDRCQNRINALLKEQH